MELALTVASVVSAAGQPVCSAPAPSPNLPAPSSFVLALEILVKRSRGLAFFPFFFLKWTESAVWCCLTEACFVSLTYSERPCFLSNSREQIKGQALGGFCFKHFVITNLQLGINCSMNKFSHFFPPRFKKRGKGISVECLAFLKLGVEANCFIQMCLVTQLTWHV